MPVAVQGMTYIHDPSDSILKGLDVARQVYGIKEATDARNKLLAEQKKKDAEEQYQASTVSPERQEIFKGYGLDVSGLTNKQIGERYGTEKDYAQEKFKAALKPPEDQEKRKLEMDKLRSEIAKNYKSENKEKTFTEGQSNAGLFAKRMEQAESDMNNILSKTNDKGELVYDPTSTAAAIQRGKIHIPLLGDFGTPEIAKSGEHKQFEQAKRNFINATLRRESGAAIGKDEYENATQQYFPVVGDTPEVLDQKKQNRLLAIEGIKMASGGAYDKLSGMGSVALKSPSKQKHSVSSLKEMSDDQIDALYKKSVGQK